LAFVGEGNPPQQTKKDGKMKDKNKDVFEEIPAIESIESPEIKESKKKKKSYKVHLVSQTWVMYVGDSGSLVWTSNIWKNIKKGDEIII
jgi:hypothetical protein